MYNSLTSHRPVKSFGIVAAAIYLFTTHFVAVGVDGSSADDDGIQATKSSGVGLFAFSVTRDFEGLKTVIELWSREDDVLAMKRQECAIGDRLVVSADEIWVVSRITSNAKDSTHGVVELTNKQTGKKQTRDTSIDRYSEERKALVRERALEKRKRENRNGD